jgi:hypothetical protein
MPKKIVKLTESQLVKIIEKVISEDMGGMDDVHPVYGEMGPDDLMSLVKNGTIGLRKKKSPSKFEDLEVEDEVESIDDDAMENERIKRRLERQHQFESRKRR